MTQPTRDGTWVHTRLRCGHTAPGICRGAMWCAECEDFSPVDTTPTAERIERVLNRP